LPRKYTCSFYGTGKYICTFYGTQKYICTFYSTRKYICTFYGAQKYICTFSASIYLVHPICNNCYDYHSQYNSDIPSNSFFR
jgi:hypothetical protein